MSISADDLTTRALAVHVDVSEDTLSVGLTDGRTICAPIAWYPRLANGAREEQARWELIGSGHGIHWPDLDEDISVEALLEGRGSDEAQSSLRKWLASRSG